MGQPSDPSQYLGFALTRVVGKPFSYYPNVRVRIRLKDRLSGKGKGKGEGMG